MNPKITIQPGVLPGERLLEAGAETLNPQMEFSDQWVLKLIATIDFW